MFAELNGPASQGVIRNLIFKFMGRIEKSTNDIIKVLVDPVSCSIRYTGALGTSLSNSDVQLVNWDGRDDSIRNLSTSHNAQYVNKKQKQRSTRSNGLT